MMNVSIQEKKDFITWFLYHHMPENREVVWLLEYIQNRNELLQSLHFVFDAHFCPRSIVIHSAGQVKQPFRFYKSHICTIDVDKAFHDVRLNQQDPLYVECIFESVRQSPEYARVLEVNPYVPDKYYLNEEDLRELDSFLV